jgi:hypothetical protein
MEIILILFVNILNCKILILKYDPNINMKLLVHI